MTHPESGTVTYTYNADGTVATKVDAKNQKIAYSYDGYKRLGVVRRYPVSTGPEDVYQAVFFFYDTDRQDPSNTYGFLYNGWGRLTSVEWYVLGYRIIERYSYYASGLVYKKRLHVTSGTNWPTTAGAALGPTDYYMESTYTYNNEGKMVSVTYPGDTHTSGPGRTAAAT